MTLAELLESIDSLDDSLTIYVKAQPKWEANSEAVAVEEPTDGSLPAEAEGMQYFLEVYLAKEILENWRKTENGQISSLLERCNAVIYYAEHDSYHPADSN